ncbi:MAG: polyprenyl synthetase family protein [bacterium]
MLGGLLAGKNIEEMKKIEEVGELLGLVFQIKDNELSIFASEEELGKKVGIDIIENKKTHYRELLYQKSSIEEKEFLNKTFGDENLTFDSIMKVREMMINKGVREELQNKMNDIVIKSKNILTDIEFNPNSKEVLISFMDYLLYRTK